MPQEKIILASASPRRRELLAELGIQFEVITADVIELESVSSLHPTPIELALENARRKAQTVSASQMGRWVLGADTVVTLEGKLFGKPASQAEAQSFLRDLSGKTHEVITACVLIEPSGTRHEFHDATQVLFRTLNPEIIDRYVSEVHVLDKAGAYGLQEHGDWIIERVEGSRTNVIGLPTEMLAKHFRAAGLL